MREVGNPRAIHEAICAEVKKASQRTADLKRKATEAHKKTRSHRERCKIITNEHTRSEAAVNHSLGFLGLGLMGWCVKETAAATHSLTCGVPDRESTQMRYLKQAIKLIEEWQKLLQGALPVNAQTSEHGEVVLVERQRSETVKVQNEGKTPETVECELFLRASRIGRSGENQV